MPITEADELRHTPGDSAKYQESVFLIWYDATSQLGGAARIGLEPNLSKANMWTYVSKAGKPLLCKTDLSLPLPAVNWDNIQVGPIRRRTIKPLNSFAIDIQDEGVHAALTFNGFHEPFDYEFGRYKPGGHAAAGHYEGSGDVRGTLKYRNERLTVSGLGHHDHSWGPRHWDRLDEWIWIAGASPDHQLSFNATWAVYRGSIQMFGYVFDGKSSVALPENTLTVDMNEDGRMHDGVSGTLFAADGRSFEIVGEVTAVGALPHGTVVAAEGLTRFRVGDREAFGVAEHGYRVR